MQRFELTLAWRHLRAQRKLPGWARVISWLSGYMVLAGLALIVFAIYAPPELNPLGPPNAHSYEWMFGGATAALGGIGLCLTGLLRVFNLLATLIIVSVAQGCMALVVVLSLMGGLGNDLEQRIRSHGADIQVQASDGLEFEGYEALVETLEADPEIVGVSPYLFGEVMLRSTYNRLGVKLHGIDPQRHARTSGLPKDVREGAYAFLQHPEAIAGYVARYAPESHKQSRKQLEETDSDGAAGELDDTDGADDVLHEQQSPDAEHEPDEWDDQSSGDWEDAEHEVGKLRTAGSLPARGADSTQAAKAWVLAEDALDGNGSDEPGDSDDSDDSGDVVAPEESQPTAPDTPDEWDDASSGDWEDAQVEVERLRAAGDLPPRGVDSTTQAAAWGDGPGKNMQLQQDPPAGTPSTAPPDPSGDDWGEGAWEDPSHEIPNLRDAGVLPTKPEVESPKSEVRPTKQVSEPPRIGRTVRPPVLIGRELAESLGVHTGDPVQVITPVTRITPAGVVPGVLAAQISGVYYSGVYELDSERVYLPLDLAQRLLRSGPKVTAIAIRVDNFEAIDRVHGRVQTILAAHGRQDLEARDYRTLNRNLFTAMMLERLAMVIALLFVIVVAAFGILASNLMAVLDRAREIAILKTMGCDDQSVTRVFVGEGLLLGVLGSLAGVTVGLVICAVLAKTGLPIDEGVFYMEKLPVEVHALEVVGVAVAAIVIVWISSLYPARVAGALAPVDVLRSSEL